MKQLYAVALAAAFGLPAASSPVLAQDTPSRAAQAAIDHFRAQAAAYTGRTAAGSEAALATADVDELLVQSEAPSLRAGVRHVYLRQAIGGIPVANGRANATVGADGKVAIAFSRMVAGVDARRSGAETPSLTPESAIAAAAAGLGLEFDGAVSAARRADAAPGVSYYDAPGLATDAIRSELVYFATEAGPVRLAYDLAVPTLDQKHAWQVKVDAETGALLDQQDLVVHENHVASFVPQGTSAPSLAPLAAPAPALGGGASYRVAPYPFGAPDVAGGLSLVSDPADPTYSPQGWHESDDQSFTITRGNNVRAYEDRGASNVEGEYADGGASLTFDFAFDDVDTAPESYMDAALTNLFYWNNVVHDVAAAYGFDEESGNFQRFNYSGAEGSNDEVRAEAQDGSGSNNANFYSPPDGLMPRMQMYEWRSRALNVVIESLDSPDVAGTVLQEDLRPTGFDGRNPNFPVSEAFPRGGFSGQLAVMESEDANPLLGCGEVRNPNQLAGKIALIQRGSCFFVHKFQRAQDAGAIGVLLFNEPGREAPPSMGGPNPHPGDPSDPDEPDIPINVNIPGLFLDDVELGLLLADELGAGSEITVSMIKLLPDRDSDFDAGVIAHEYGHGISNRLTGGRLDANCLNTNLYPQQMGEGWSDFYGLMLTQHDPNQRTRGVGTYLVYEGNAEGVGIRPHPYSPDMSVNPVTYGDVRNAGNNFLSIPHGVGYAFNSVLWDLAWELVDRYGRVGNAAAGPDAEGADFGGFNVATALVTESLKMQPCGPGQLDGRDAIIAADAVLYGGIHAEELSAAFSRRGYGQDASQGSRNSLTGIVQDFTPLEITTVANEGAAPALTEAFRVSAAFPNPASDRAALRVEVREAQDVLVEVFDVMGRRVALLHDGPMAAGQRQTMTFATGTLAPGAYLIRVQGEHFQAMRRVTLAR